MWSKREVDGCSNNRKALFSKARPANFISLEKQKKNVKKNSGHK
jgi:hypothetical protein